jgi:hypothetical protein
MYATSGAADSLHGMMVETGDKAVKGGNLHTLQSSVVQPSSVLRSASMGSMQFPSTSDPWRQVP